MLLLCCCVGCRAMLPQELLPQGLVESALEATSHFASCTAEAIRDALDKAGLPPNGPTSTAIRRAKVRRWSDCSGTCCVSLWRLPSCCCNLCLQ